MNELLKSSKEMIQRGLQGLRAPAVMKIQDKNFLYKIMLDEVDKNERLHNGFYSDKQGTVDAMKKYITSLLEEK